MNIQKYLPIGTVVLLKNGEKKVMITGFTAKANNSDEKIYDYTGCLYPEGVLNSEINLLFDHNQIDKVYYMGYNDNEWKQIEEKIKKFSESLKNN